MGRDGFGQVRWNTFDGGIEQVPERAQPGQVLDARNVWAPYGPVERRPGTRFIDALVQSEDTPYAGTRVDTFDSGTGLWTITYTIVGSPSTPAGGFVLYALAPPLIDGYPSGFRELPLVSGPALTDFTNPSATRVFQLSNLTGSEVTSTREAPVFRYTPQAVPFVVAEFPWGPARAVIYVFEVTSTSGDVFVVFATAARDGGRTSAFITGTSIVETKAVTPGESALWIKKQPHTASRISTLAAIPYEDVIYLTYNQTIYQLTPAGGFDLAVSNTDPDFVGPRQSGGVTPPFSVDVIAQLSAPPRANIVTYFSGFVFALDMVGDPYSVRWSAPVIETGPNLVWPAQNFEPIDEDGGRPRAAKPLSEFLVVYQSTNIYTFVADTPDAITGLATFDPKRVVSGVGTESHNAVVEVQGRHFFPSRDGFYAFDGSPTPQKLSQPIDQFYQRLGRSALADARGVHWLEKHCVLWTVRQGAATDPHGLQQQMHYIILYDYIKNAWWIWDNVAGGGGLARMFVTDVQAGIYILSSVALLYRLTGNSDGAPGATWDGLFLQSTSSPVDMPAAYILTHRLGEAAFQAGISREIWVEATTDADSMQVEIIVDDDADPNPRTLSMRTDDAGAPVSDIRWNATKWGQSTWQANKRRPRLLGSAAAGHHVQLKITLINALNRAWKLVRAGLSAVKLRRP